MEKRGKKWLALLLAGVMTTGLAACGGPESDRQGTGGKDNAAIQSDIPEAVPVFQQTGNDGSQLTGEQAHQKIAYAGDNIPISRALVAKMLAYIEHDSAEIDGMERVITFLDTSPEQWYDRYINAVVTEGYMNGGGAQFMPDKPLTLYQAQVILDKINPDNTLKIQISDENKDKAISYALWTDLYYETLVNRSGERSVIEATGLMQIDVIVLATPDNNSQMKSWNMVTATGPLSYKGLSMEAYIDKQISILKKDGEVIAFLGVADHAPVIRNAFIVSMTADSITIFAGGCERTYYYTAAGLPQGDVCDIKINGQKAEAVTVYSQKITGVVKKASATMIEVEGKGRLPLAAEAKIYAITDGVPKWKNLNALTMGTDIAEYVMADGVIGAILIVKTTLPQTMRVALHTSGFKGLLHASVALTSDQAYTVKVGDTVKSYKPGDVFALVYDADTVFTEGIHRVIVQAENGGKIQIDSIDRNWPDGASPRYRGIIEIAREEGGYAIVNELSMDEYLYAVVPSEMPTGHGVEAAKVQAITARSYAYNQYYANRFYAYGANIDDSVNCQVYNNTPENDTSIQAVNATTGQCLVAGGSVLSANYFSTSSGMTANSGQVWANTATKKFPSDTPAYLAATRQYTSGDYGDLTIEENAARFLKDTTVESYDAAFPWFRWNVSMTAAELSASINSSLRSRYEANPKLIQTFDAKDNIFKSTPIDSIGDLKAIEVIERGQGGNIMKLKITGSAATILVQTEYNIRMLLKPARVMEGGRDIVINRKDGSTITNYSILPSAFFVLDMTRDAGGNLTEVFLSGGGNGHGVGMSQNGVKGMIDKGFGVEEILAHYYPGATVKKMI